MRTIWKFQLQITDYQDVAMPLGASILCAAVQEGQLCIWAQVFSDAVLQTRRIHIFGTGNPMPVQVRYIGSVQMPPFVWHVYEEPR